MKGTAFDTIIIFMITNEDVLAKFICITFSEFGDY